MKLVLVDSESFLDPLFLKKGEVASRMAMFGGLRIDIIAVSPLIIKVSSLSGLPFRSGDKGMTQTIELKENTSHILHTFGERFVFSIQGDGFEIGRIARKLPPIKPVPVFSQDVLGWCDLVEDDLWLRQEVQNLLHEEADEWDIAVAVGTFARLREFSPNSTRELVSKLLAGEPNERMDAPIRWAQALEPSQKKALEQSFAIECDMWLEKLEELDESIDLDNEFWRYQVLRLLRKRTDLESVLFVLHHAGCDEGVMYLLNDFVDYPGIAWLHSLPMLPEFGREEFLRREYLSNPNAWWTSPVEEALGGLPPCPFLWQTFSHSKG
ncbi:MAG: hypothetical protein CO137_00530 [Candidatus Magasanikbacteria bacterium CG_4_9_14_3_um_filter_32_9]|uniref:Uncharacterized protein n=1 Tax=Candidatus Magasanikbacteria bacterium CG_4_9_14_3_um_filter_32_9 TaxID=1974644 RepID=A0A2M7Z7K4_9BACT|nr:MAG: hypothetical protein CO137_00530 [Candidatus Magasanikbacteria bacterium CG_4_9_14_3_um_filter_32_9]